MILQTQEIMNTVRGGESYLITGACGFIGLAITKFLHRLNKEVLNEPCKIIIAVRNKEKAIRKLGSILEDDNVELLVCDNKDEIKYTGNIDWMIHAAAATKKDYFVTNPADTITENVFGVYHCLEAAKDKRVKGVVFISSVLVYGKTKAKAIAENDFGPLDSMQPATLYAESKRCGEMLCWSYAKQFEIPAKCVRLFHVYGEGEEYNNGTFLSSFFEDIRQRKNIVISGKGTEVRNLCYIQDVIRGILCVLHRGEPGEAYNIGSNKNNFTIAETAILLQELAEEEGIKLQVIIRGEDNHQSHVVNRQVPDLSKLKNLGWMERDNDIRQKLKKIIKLMPE